MENIILILLILLFLCSYSLNFIENYTGITYPMNIINPKNKILYRNYYNPKRFNSGRIINVP